MKRIAVSWIGKSDLKAAGILKLKNGEIINQNEKGPIYNSLTQHHNEYDQICLLDDSAKGDNFKKWIEKQLEIKPDVIQIHHVELTRPTDYDCIFVTTRSILDDIEQNIQGKVKFDFLISPGTSQMTTTWILLSQTLFPGSRLIESSREEGWKVINIPFSIYSRYKPKKQKKEELRTILGDQPYHIKNKIDDAFTGIQGESESLKEALLDAKTYSLFDFPVLILGETGTGKELFAKAIHRASSRREDKCLSINMGAISSELIDSELFGHEKGAHSEAHQRRIGHFEEADRGTIFLDEIGNMLLPHQGRLLRVLQDGSFQRVGSSKTKYAKCRVIAATNKNLDELCQNRQFMPDLYLRLKIALLKLPPLRERKEDIPKLAEYFLKKNYNDNKDSVSNYPKRSLDPKALELLVSYDWPGNIRELENVIIRLCIDPYSHNVIEKHHVEREITSSQYSDKLISFVKEGLAVEKIKFEDLISDIEKYSLEYAMSKSRGVKENARKILQLNRGRIQYLLKKYPNIENKFSN